MSYLNLFSSPHNVWLPKTLALILMC